MEFVQRAKGHPATVGILAGSFNPPTIAHLELMQSGSRVADEILCVLPRVFPHKEYFGATLEQRLEMLQIVTVELTFPCSIATSERGLFVDIARECRDCYGDATQISLLCGADAAERILTWDYGRDRVVEEMLTEFEMRVAPRGLPYTPPPAFSHRIHPLLMNGEHHQVSSTAVRERIRQGQAWGDLVPRAIVDSVREIYGNG